MGKIVQTAGRTALGEYAPQFAHFNDDVLFGENWNNRGRVCQDTFCGFSKLNDLSVKKPPKTSCLQMS